MHDSSFDSEPTLCEENSQKQKKLAYLFVIAAAILWGTIGVFGKKLTSFGFEPIQIVFIRAVGAAAILILVALINNTDLLKIEPRDSIYFIGTGILSFVFFNWCYFIAINKTSLSIAAILLYTAPTIVMVLSAILFKEKMTKKKIVSLVLTFVGCIFVTAFVKETGSKITIAGLLAGLGAGLGYALYSIFGRYALKKYDPVTVTLYTFIFASVSLIPFTDFKEMVSLFSNVSALYFAVALGLFATVMPFLLYTNGLSNLETSRASIIATLEPVVATMIGVVLFGEPLTLYKILGISLVIFAISINKEKGGVILSQMSKDSMVEALKPLLKKNNFKKTRATWHKVLEDFILVINVQGSQWGEDYYINIGVYFKALGTELNPPESLCHIQARLAYENKSVETIVEEALNWLNTYSNISVLESLHRENKLPPMTSAKAKEYLDSRIHLSENREL